ncbi:MAG: hypothetical protein ACRCXB_18740 [Aeromonadaceae bacterium]
MIDLDAIEAEIDDAIGCADGQAPIQCSDAKEIIARLRQAEKDAARYRWLRSCDTAESKRLVSKSGGWIVGLGVLDGMIDEAMQCK